MMEEFEQAQCWVRADSEFTTNAGPNRLLWNGLKYHLPPPAKDPKTGKIPDGATGVAVQVPRPLVHLWLGDPDLRDDPQNQRYPRARSEERERVLAKWGQRVGGVGTEGVQPLPTIHAWDFDQNYLTTIIADPDGVSTVPDEQSAYTEEQLNRAMKQMEQQRQALIQAARQQGYEIPEEFLGGAADVPALAVEQPEPQAPPALVTTPGSPQEVPSVDKLPTPPDPTATPTKRPPGRPRKQPIGG